MAKVRVLVEVTRRRSFASALDWPGWSRSGTTPDDALDALESYRARYAGVLAASALVAPTGALEVVEQLEGDATTAFGAPSIVATLDHRSLRAADRTRLVAHLEACWSRLEDVVASTTTLRPGPRGGGRTVTGVHDHVAGADEAYARGLGLRVSSNKDDQVAIDALRARVVGVVLGTVTPERVGRWPVRYAVRRSAWHACDHVFEIEDRASS